MRFDSIDNEYVMSTVSQLRQGWICQSATPWKMLFQILLLCFAISPTTATSHLEISSRLNNHSTSSTPSPSQDWVSAPNQRGSIEIIWSCLATIFLCAWFSLCLNIPAATESRQHVFREKILMASLTVLGPEFLFLIALGQWQSARQSVQAFHSSGYDQWTMTHAFYADMGGFILQTSDHTPFPITAKQLHYLITNSYLEHPDLDECEIEDRNKVDDLARAIIIIQVGWFTVNSIGRAVQHLAITTGELTVLGFILCTFGTTFSWFHNLRI
jgi:hypothetical protein